MFIRTRRVGRLVYTEALESYRDPATGKPKHRHIARWKADQPFAVALAQARARFGNASESRVYWQGILDGTVRPIRRGMRRRSPDKPKNAIRHLAWLDRGVAHLAGLEAVHAKLPAAEADIQAATDAMQERAEQIRLQTTAFTIPPP